MQDWKPISAANQKPSTKSQTPLNTQGLILSFVKLQKNAKIREDFRKVDILEPLNTGSDKI